MSIKSLTSKFALQAEHPPGRQSEKFNNLQLYDFIKRTQCVSSAAKGYMLSSLINNVLKFYSKCHIFQLTHKS